MEIKTFSLLLLVLLSGCGLKEIDRSQLKFGDNPFSADSIFNKSQTISVFYKGKKFTGYATEKYGNGQLMYKLEFKDGLANGSSEEFYSSSKKKSIGAYLDGHGIGTFEEYYENGNMKMTGKLNGKGKIDGISTFYSEDGKKLESIEFKNGLQNGYYFEYFPDGKVHRKISYRDGKKDGEATLYFENGKLQGQLLFKDGKMNGAFTTYDEDGTSMKGTYKNDEINGKVQKFNQYGKLIDETTYLNGKEVKYSITQNNNNSENFESTSDNKYKFSVVGNYRTEDYDGPVVLNGLCTFVMLNKNGLIFMAMGRSINEAFSDAENGIKDGRIIVGKYTFDQTWVRVTWNSGKEATWEYAGLGTIRCGNGVKLELYGN